jgi:hypothetical protein
LIINWVIFPSNYEIIGRYSTQTVETTSGFGKYKAVLFGVTKYIWEHTFKIRELTFDTSYFNGSTKNNFYVRFQVKWN